MHAYMQDRRLLLQEQGSGHAVLYCVLQQIFPSLRHQARGDAQSIPTQQEALLQTHIKCIKMHFHIDNTKSTGGHTCKMSVMGMRSDRRRWTVGVTCGDDHAGVKHGVQTDGVNIHRGRHISKGQSGSQLDANNRKKSQSHLQLGGKIP